MRGLSRFLQAVVISTAWAGLMLILYAFILTAGLFLLFNTAGCARVPLLRHKVTGTVIKAPSFPICVYDQGASPILRKPLRRAIETWNVMTRLPLFSLESDCAGPSVYLVPFDLADVARPLAIVLPVDGWTNKAGLPAPDGSLGPPTVTASRMIGYDPLAMVRPPDQLESLMSHELAHVLGLAHNNDRLCQGLMNHALTCPSRWEPWEEEAVHPRTPSREEVDTVRELYSPGGAQ